MAQTSTLIEQRTDALAARLQQMREMDEWHLFQNFILGLLPHGGYTDVRVSAVRNDFGRDGVAMTPDQKKCVVAVSFDCTLPKIRNDAKRWTEDPNREEAAVLLFAANDAPQGEEKGTQLVLPGGFGRVAHFVPRGGFAILLSPVTRTTRRTRRKRGTFHFSCSNRGRPFKPREDSG